ncbi:hypothetical protein OUZ56_008613 [Daphnia magna]|uniref:Uncharacterized protein n=1 Tax=Daphnia magna TaxID=35525 RepID=A0ABR0ADI3_9CRUS|nr:hypothetical protein OUZ56_008613 [Daphnia magna]
MCLKSSPISPSPISFRSAASELSAEILSTLGTLRIWLKIFWPQWQEKSTLERRNGMKSND